MPPANINNLRWNFPIARWRKEPVPATHWLNNSQVKVAFKFDVRLILLWKSPISVGKLNLRKKEKIEYQVPNQHQNWKKPITLRPGQKSDNKEKKERVNWIKIKLKRAQKFGHFQAKNRLSRKIGRWSQPKWKYTKQPSEYSFYERHFSNSPGTNWWSC